MATVRHRKPENYLAAVSRNGHGIAEETALSRESQAAEAVLMGLRLTEGIDLARLARRFGFQQNELILPEKCAFYAQLGLLRTDGSHLSVTEAGAPVLEALLAELVPAGLVAS